MIRAITTLLLISNLTMAQSIKVKDSIILNNLKILNLAIFEKNTLTSKIIESDYHTYKYNSDGNPTFLYTKDNTNHKTTFSYDEKGRLVEVSYGQKDNYFYDENDNFIIKTTNNLVVEERQYDKNNNLINLRKINKNGQLMTYEKAIYDTTTNQILKKELYNIDSQNKYNESIYKYENDKLLTEIIYSSYNADGSLWFQGVTKKKYNSKNLVSEIIVEQDGKTASHELLIYDEDNNLIQNIYVDSLQMKKKVNTFKYFNCHKVNFNQLYFNLINQENKVFEKFIDEYDIKYILDNDGNVVEEVHKQRYGSNGKFEESGRNKYKFIKITRE